MLLKLLVYATTTNILLAVCVSALKEKEKCLTGTMTDVQSWVDVEGRLLIKDKYAIDLSQYRDASKKLQDEILNKTKNIKDPIRYLSMAKCNMSAIPTVFEYTYSNNTTLSRTLEYLSLYGNKFQYFKMDTPKSSYRIDMNATDAKNWTADEVSVLSKYHTVVVGKRDTPSWDIGLRYVEFSALLELDLRACSLHYINDRVFMLMPELRALYLSENNLNYISSLAFMGLTNLKHLDMSNNEVKDFAGGADSVLLWESEHVFAELPELLSLDLSYTRVSHTSASVFKGLGRKFEKLSLCYSCLDPLLPDNFRQTNLKYLDVSGNIGIFINAEALRGVEKSMKIIYADNVALNNMFFLNNFTSLEYLKLSNNEISNIQPTVLKNLNNLKVLDLDRNRIAAWKSQAFSLMPNLTILTMRSNNINLMKPDIIEDISDVGFVALSGNLFMCNCYARDFFQIASTNELKDVSYRRNVTWVSKIKKSLEYTTAYTEYNEQIMNRNTVKIDCFNKTDKASCDVDGTTDFNADFLLLDYDPGEYNCLSIDSGNLIRFQDVAPCAASRMQEYQEYINNSWKMIIAIIVIGLIMVSILFVCILFRRRIKYFAITVKNSALLSMIDNQRDLSTEGNLFVYDVFVSYCNDDRAWVLDNLLPHVEKDCNISVCLHERDFQVGLSILENIVSSMDRSRLIMLVISQKFLLSQWCQFEMHLAQHRLLETRREDLILILIEDIPRHLRPNTLHYLMLSKTYLLWPPTESEQTVFWKRLNKSIMANKQYDNSTQSLA